MPITSEPKDLNSILQFDIQNLTRDSLNKTLGENYFNFTDLLDAFNKIESFDFLNSGDSPKLRSSPAKINGLINYESINLGDDIFSSIKATAALAFKLLAVIVINVAQIVIVLMETLLKSI